MELKRGCPNNNRKTRPSVFIYTFYSYWAPTVCMLWPGLPLLGTQRWDKTLKEFRAPGRSLIYIKMNENGRCCQRDKHDALQGLRKYKAGLPCWRSGWESACQCRGHGFEPWSGRIPRAAERLGLWATVAEPARLEPVLRNGRGRDGERPAHRDEEWPPLAAARGSPRTETKTQHSHK